MVRTGATYARGGTFNLISTGKNVDQLFFLEYINCVDQLTQLILVLYETIFCFRYISSV